MSTYGLTPAGFVVKPLAAILASMQAKMLALISPSLDVQPTALMGILSGIVAGEIAPVWELQGAQYNGMDADQATNDQLAGLALLTGTLRESATATVIKSVTVNVGAGFHAEPGMMFASVIGNPANLFYNLAVVDSVGGGNVSVDFICQDTGPVQALAGTLTVIAQPLTGWNSVTNPNDGLVGSPIENDANLRTRRQLELSAAGASTVDAIRGVVLRQMQPDSSTPTTVATTSVTVLHNDTDLVDANGLPPHSVEVIARAPGATSGDDQLLANLIANEKAAGDGTNGTTSKTVTDSQGNTDNIKFTRPTDVPLTVTLDLTVNDNYPPDGDDQVKQALVDFAMGNSAKNIEPEYEPGVEVFSLRLVSQAFNVPGVEDITAFTVNGGTANIAIDVRSVATLSTGDITVTS